MASFEREFRRLFLLSDISSFAGTDKLPRNCQSCESRSLLVINITESMSDRSAIQTVKKVGFI